MADLPKSVLITGAAKRIGAELARGFAVAGWHVAIHCNRSVDDAAGLLDEIRTSGGRGHVVTGDLCDPSVPDSLIARAQAGAPPLVGLVNNASLFEYDAAGSLEPDLFDRHMSVNARAPVLLSQAFYRSLSSSSRGCIVNLLDNKISSVNPDYLSYTISKFALYGATKALSMALAPRVRVNGIAPGITLESGGQGAESFENGQRMSPLGRVSTPEDIVRAAIFLFETPSLNGHVITIDGGQSLQNLPRDVAFLTPDEGEGAGQ